MGHAYDEYMVLAQKLGMTSVHTTSTVLLLDHYNIHEPTWI
jgi:hypothetical protein